MKQTITSIIISAILFGVIFTIISLITGDGNLLERFGDGAFCGAFYGVFDPLIQKWRNKKSV